MTQGHMTPGWSTSVDVVVVGTGVAGLTCALDLAAAGRSVLVVTKAELTEGNTRFAQGGVAVADAPGDTIADHVADTLAAGAGLSDPVAVRSILAAGPGAVRRLIARGCRFDAFGTTLVRTREGGHHRDRIVHAGGDATGREIERALAAAPGLPAVLTEHLAVDIAVDARGYAAGIYLLDADGRLALIRAGAVVLATGGAGQLFAASTNPAVATADGLAMALRAGAAACDLEFVQFHPTALWTDAAEGRLPLVTEALRGAGATLLDGAGRSVTAGVHPLGDLAPRDVVSGAIARRLRERPGGIGDHVFLDARAVVGVRERFPSVTASCAAIGVDPVRELIPVAPAAHYQCGGIWTDLTGASTLPGLYAAGEVARTGLHGANRLASNSLLEGLVMGERVARSILASGRSAAVGDLELQPPANSWADPAGRARLQAAMSRDAGIGRTAAGLRAASDVADQVLAARTALGRAAVEATNLAQVSAAVLFAAAYRTESRGCQVRTDRPLPDPAQGRSSTVWWQHGRPVVRADVPTGVAVAA